MNSNLPLGLANDIKNAFGIGGETVKAEAFGNGNINDTYLVYIQSGDSVARYIFQRVNRAVFTNPEDIAKNVSGVTTHIANKLRLAGEKDIERRVVKYYRNISGGYYHITESGDYWRVMSYIYDSVCFDTADNTLLFNTGVAFGEFQRLLSDFPAETLCVTIPDFHNTPARYAQLALAAGADAFSRLCEVKAEYDYLLSQSENACRLCRLADSGAIPLRVVHNDTKCNNVMFDAKTGKNLAVVDLDTVMPGLIAYDFGDARIFPKSSLIRMPLRHLQGAMSGRYAAAFHVSSSTRLPTVSLPLHWSLRQGFLLIIFAATVISNAKRNAIILYAPAPRSPSQGT